MDTVAAYWDRAADAFDDEPDHGLRPPRVAAAWAARLAAWLPESPADVLDLGCGTGSLAAVVARRGHRVTGVDLSPRMVERARRKLAAAGLDARFVVGDAADPPGAALVGVDRPRGAVVDGDLARGAVVDVVLARHLLWALPDPVAALRRWIALCRPGGRLILVEGRWATASDGEASPGGAASAGGACAASAPWFGGVPADTLAATLRPLVADLRVEPLTDPDLWGRPITDERYALLATI